MKIPFTFPYYKLAVAVVGLYAIAWMALEGELWRDILLAVAVMILSVAYALRRRWGGRTLSADLTIVFSTVTGLVFGLGIVFLTLFLMALKTGIHAHGPEYTAREIAWIWDQLPVWSGAGALAGLGVGLLMVARIRK